ncbi:topless-related protein 1-like [Pyrus ussuriensis x Pyrus communis]|uniref:Topless-related protein 1-like n=1 Tax=Pyrus ussuriensis x Pyrus communis TaxID=2448454 RepID=A0A5N5FWB6_9ROSA|nr:topless-related protein 1-like [Pyrus ussuriensis x Pyrus communis]
MRFGFMTTLAQRNDSHHPTNATAAISIVVLEERVFLAKRIFCGFDPRLVSRRFTNSSGGPVIFWATLIRDPCVSVKRILWSPMVLYLELHIQLYSYFGGDEIHQHLEIDAHAGSVNDLAFCNPAMQLCAIPCGDDKAIKFFFSTSINGKIKAWLYDNMGYRVDYDAPGHNNSLWCRW